MAVGSKVLRRRIPVMLAMAVAACADGPPRAMSGQPVPLVPGARTVGLAPGVPKQIGTAYWVDTQKGCGNLLTSVRSVEPTSPNGPVTLSLEQKDVQTSQCGNTVPGAAILATANAEAGPQTFNLAYQVNYYTVYGPRTSSQSINVSIVPK